MSSYENNIDRVKDKKKLDLFIDDYDEFKLERDTVVRYNESGYEIMQNILNGNLEAAKEKNKEFSDFNFDDLIRKKYSEEEAKFLFMMDVHNFIACCEVDIEDYEK